MKRSIKKISKEIEECLLEVEDEYTIIEESNKVVVDFEVQEDLLTCMSEFTCRIYDGYIKIDGLNISIDGDNLQFVVSIN